MGLRAAVRRLAMNSTDVEAAELAREVDEESAQHLSDCAIGEQVTVFGKICSVTLRPPSESRAFEAELYDGSGRVRLVWLGRRIIPGIEAGRSVVVSGRLTAPVGHELTLFNPTYTLKPRSAE